jgi:hypothetical protein
MMCPSWFADGLWFFLLKAGHGQDVTSGPVTASPGNPRLLKTQKHKLP